MPPPLPNTTKDQILDAAEALFAEEGYAATPLRAITARAGVNLAAVHYHFGSKEELAKAVFARRIAPINRERLRRLDALPADAAGLEPVVRAFLEPAIEIGVDPERGAAVKRLMGRIYAGAPEFVRRMMREEFRDVAERFGAALRPHLPHLDGQGLLWRFHFMIGAMAHALCFGQEITEMNADTVSPIDTDRLTGELVAFCIAGLRSGGEGTT